MPLRATVKSIAKGVVDNPMQYSPRPRGLRPLWIGSSTALRKTELTVASIRHDIVVLLPNQCKNKFTLCQELSI